MTDLISLRDAAEILGVDVLFLTHIIDVGDVLPTPPVPKDYRDIVFTADDIERFRPEIDRRRFTDFKMQYVDVYQQDEGRGAGGLEFGPGWEGLLRNYADGLRALNAAGGRSQLRWGKEKFGALHLYSDYLLSTESEVINLHREAYRSSLQTCQECGSPARLRFGYSVCLTLCDRHAHLVGEPDPARDGIILDVSAWNREQGRIAE
ncbi:hypothetical protein [Rhizobium ruizarguesonis]|uniref:hypothetical protein n=1 Tax=Rhizobium ruizarguesonis TaxID=2081791 RepID=UPI00102F3CBF|nr:hypothetical protein [Rhizobium ruizarguesonis]TAV14749.1 hypothetical protein ELI34_04375 [Rhizobium ruizarguesonis]